MKINFKIGMYSLAIFSTLFFIGCGSGGDTSTVDIDNGKDPATTGKFKYNRVSIAGSSITYGGGGGQGGYLGEKSYVGEVMKYLMEDVADTINPTELKRKDYDSNISELYSYQGELIVYNSGSKISGTLKASDEIVIVYGASNAVVEMKVDGKVCGTKTIGTGFKPVLVEYPNNPKEIDESSGIEVLQSFRQTDERSVSKICTNLENKSHNFELTVKSGQLHLNFITNHMYYFQNAGIGAYRASDLLSETAKVSTTTTDQIVAFNPDLFILESATNDAQRWGMEDTRSTNHWKIDAPTTCTVDNNRIIGLNTSNIVKGDIVIIGEYGSYINSGDEYKADIKNMAVGIVSNIKNGNIILENSVVKYDGSVVSGTSQCKVKSISSWSDDVKKVVKRVKAGVNSYVKVGICTSGVPNYWDPRTSLNKYLGKSRRLLGYREVGQNLASEKGWMFFDFFKATMSVNSGVDAGHNDADKNWVPSKWSVGDNTHPKYEGFPIFGSAITDVLKAQ